MKKLLIAAAALAALSASAFAQTADDFSVRAPAAASDQAVATVQGSGSEEEVVVLPGDGAIDYSTTQSIAEEVPLGLQLRNAEILYNRFNR